MDIKDLRMLAGIAEVGTLSGAARKLNMTQPALSAVLKRLEGELDVRLVIRHPRGVDFTDHGKFVLERAYGILHDVAETKMAVRDLASQPGGKVAIGLPTTVAPGLGPVVLRRIRERYPRIRLQLVEAMSGSLVEMLQLGRLDMAILFDNQPMPGLRSEPILVEELYLLVSGESPLARRRTIAFADIGGIDLVMPSQNHSIRKLLDGAAQAEGIALRVEADVDSLASIVSLVQAGFAAILPTFQVRTAIEAGAIHPIEIKRPNLSWTLHLATRRDSVRPQASMAVADLTIEVAGELVRDGVWPAKLHPRVAR